MIKLVRTTIILMPLLTVLLSWGGYALQLGTTKLTDYYGVLILKFHTSPEKLAKAINAAIGADKVNYASTLIEINHDLGYPQNPLWNQRLAHTSRLRATAKEFGMGALTGDTNTPAELSGAITADLTAVGDIRDLIKEGYAYTLGEEPDMLLISLSSLGLVTTIIPTVDAGISITKMAAKRVKSHANFITFVKRELNGLINWNGVKIALQNTGANRKSVNHLMSETRHSLNTRKITTLFSSVNNINSTSGGLHNSLSIMKYISNNRSLSAARKLSKRYRHKTAALLELTKGKILIIFDQVIHLLIWFTLGVISSLLLIGQLFHFAYNFCHARWQNNSP